MAHRAVLVTTRKVAIRRQVSSSQGTGLFYMEDMMIGERLSEALARLEMTRAQAMDALEAARTSVELEEARIRYTGKKSELTRVMQLMPALRDEDKPVLGAAVNGAKTEVEQALAGRTAYLEHIELDARLQTERLDVTLPATEYPRGYVHPLMETLRNTLDIFQQMGYAVHEGPEVEWDRYNFEMLNIPKHHPARDLQDTFYVTEDIVLRTQTSPNQIRIMQQTQPPIRVVVPGVTYRNEAEDATHGDQFYQIEGLAVDRDINMADLKGTLTEVAQRLFGADRRVRFRASYFPFTEPSAEFDIECALCHGAGCRSCGNEGWLELGGCGMVHPTVLRNGGYDPEEVSGFAFGIGPNRLAMMRHAIPDLRLLTDNDLRFLRQFN
jgi:phenylalanyl-tRNA synthetase alpha chain